LTNKIDPNRFFDLVYQVARLVPPGRVTTYGAIANCIGSPQSARMVGYAMNNCHTQTEKVPAHRVVNRNGLLTGKHHFETPDTMRILLEQEGLKIVDDRIVDFANYFWDPVKEIGLPEF
jgi:methylated-DNA-protein-cysteine methyltransferase related protein